MSRAHVGLRIALFVLFSWLLGSSTSFGVTYLAFPVVAAVLIAQKGGQRFVAEDAQRMTIWLRFVSGLLAYLGLLSHELPTLARPTVILEMTPAGSPTVGSALLRILKGIPNAIVLAIFGCAGWVVWIIAAVAILIKEQYPVSLWNFQLGIVRWQVRLLAYLTSLVEPYPPFALDTDHADVAQT
jgi:hypothetical protein